MMAKLWIGFNGLDVLTTYLALRVGAVEANPLMSGLGDTVGELGGYGLKLFFAIMVVVLIYKARRLALFKWLNLGIGAVVLFNIGVLAYCLAG